MPRFTMSPLPRVFGTLLTFLLLVLVSVVGGLLNRIRGGWLNFPGRYLDQNTELGYWLTHILTRLVFALPTGILVIFVLAFIVRRSQRATERAVATGLGTATDPVWSVVHDLLFSIPRAPLLLGLWTVFLTELSLFIGWGSYFAVGHEPWWSTIRFGNLDWMVGHLPAEPFAFSTLFFHDAVAMSWRGLMWTFPVGFLFKSYGFSSLMMFSGAWMGLIYELGYLVPTLFSNFESGTPLAEFFFGTWIWFTILVSLLSSYEYRDVWLFDYISRTDEERGLLGHDFPRITNNIRVALRRLRRSWIGVHVFTVLVIVVTITSGVFFSVMYDECQQIKDMRNYYQTAVSTAVTGSLLALVYLFLCFSLKKFGHFHHHLDSVFGTVLSTDEGSIVRNYAATNVLGRYESAGNLGYRGGLQHAREQDVKIPTSYSIRRGFILPIRMFFSHLTHLAVIALVGFTIYAGIYFRELGRCYSN